MTDERGSPQVSGERNAPPSGLARLGTIGPRADSLNGQPICTFFRQHCGGPMFQTATITIGIWWSHPRNYPPYPVAASANRD
jgi:hypothetical protein